MMKRFNKRGQEGDMTKTVVGIVLLALFALGVGYFIYKVSGYGKTALEPLEGEVGILSATCSGTASQAQFYCNQFSELKVKSGKLYVNCDYLKKRYGANISSSVVCQEESVKLAAKNAYCELLGLANDVHMNDWTCGQLKSEMPVNTQTVLTDFMISGYDCNEVASVKGTGAKVNFIAAKYDQYERRGSISPKGNCITPNGEDWGTNFKDAKVFVQNNQDFTCCGILLIDPTVAASSECESLGGTLQPSECPTCEIPLENIYSEQRCCKNNC